MANPLLMAARTLDGRPRRSGSRRLNASSVYRGAQQNRLHADWLMHSLSADAILRYEMQVLRDRARELVLNSAAAARIPEIYEEQVIGENGITLQALIGSTRGGLNKRTNDLIEEAWYRWAERQTASMDGHRSWLDTETMAIRLDVVEGEFLLRHVRGADNPFGYSTEVIDPDQLDHTLNREPTASGNEIRMGVELDRWGRAVAYHLLKHHPSDVRGLVRDYDRVPADQIIHLFVQRRVRQTRGVTRLAPIIVDLKMLAGYREAVLVASRAAASVPILYEKNPEHYEIDPDEASELEEDIAPGVWGMELPPGVTPHFNNPDLPNDGFEPFEKAILRSASTGVGVSYASLSGDLTETTYGSGRIGMLAERKRYKKEQQRVIALLHTPVYREWIRMAIASGALKLDSYDSTAYHSVQWHPAPFPWIDPAKDADAEDRQLGMGVQTVTQIANEQGKDYHQVIDERAAEIEYAKEKGVPLFVDGIDVTGKFAPKPAAPAPANGRGNGNGNGKKPDDENGKANGNGAASRIPRITEVL